MLFGVAVASARQTAAHRRGPGRGNAHLAVVAGHDQAAPDQRGRPARHRPPPRAPAIRPRHDDRETVLALRTSRPSRRPGGRAGAAPCRRLRGHARSLRPSACRRTSIARSRQSIQRIERGLLAAFLDHAAGVGGGGAVAAVEAAGGRIAEPQPDVGQVDGNLARKGDFAPRRGPARAVPRGRRRMPIRPAPRRIGSSGRPPAARPPIGSCFPSDPTCKVIERSTCNLP